jgi:hypothetical protein
MSDPLSFDDEARAGMLCHLVVGELVSMARTGNGLRTGHLVELAHIWMNANGARCDWQERVATARMAADLAPDVLAASSLTTEKMLVQLFTDGWRLDYRRPVVREIPDMCAARLRCSPERWRPSMLRSHEQSLPLNLPPLPQVAFKKAQSP